MRIKVLNLFGTSIHNLLHIKMEEIKKPIDNSAKEIDKVGIFILKKVIKDVVGKIKDKFKKKP